MFHKKLCLKISLLFSLGKLYYESRNKNLTFWRVRSLEMGYLIYEIIDDCISQFGVVGWICFICAKLCLKNREFL